LNTKVVAEKIGRTLIKAGVSYEFFAEQRLFVSKSDFKQFLKHAQRWETMNEAQQLIIRCCHEWAHADPAQLLQLKQESLAFKKETDIEY
jgi:hypothetical protein